jgi:hypothetical protein
MAGRSKIRRLGGSAAAFTKNGHNHSSRIIDALTRLRCVRSFVIDGELIA